MDYRIPTYRVALVREKEGFKGKAKVTNAKYLMPLLRRYFADKDREYFVVVMLDSVRKVIGINTVSVGTLNSTLVVPREVFKPAILSNAAAVILAHNHVSGDCKPSRDDLIITRGIVEAGDLLKIKVLDHIIYGSRRKFHSMHENGGL